MVLSIRERLGNINKIFIFTVVVPTLLATIYYGMIASKVYVSESEFVVRSTDQSQSVSPLGLLLKGAGISSSQDDAYAVEGFVLSRDAMKDLEETMDLRKIFGRPEIDFVSRFPGFFRRNSEENFFKYYLNHVDILTDASTSITTLTTRAFTAETAARMNELLLQQGEALINRLNERARHDTIDVALRQVDEEEDRDKNATLQLAAYRNAAGVIDPERQSAIPLQQVANMEAQLLATQLELDQLSITAENNPQIPALRLRERALQASIDTANEKIAGNSSSLAGKAAEYQRLILEKEFSDKMLASAMATLDTARNEALHKQLYLERIAQPSLPDQAMEPRRIRIIISVLVIGLIAWGVVTMVIAGIKEHQD